MIKMQRNTKIMLWNCL